MSPSGARRRRPWERGSLRLFVCGRSEAATGSWRPRRSTLRSLYLHPRAKIYTYIIYITYIYIYIYIIKSLKLSRRSGRCDAGIEIGREAGRRRRAGGGVRSSPNPAPACTLINPATYHKLSLMATRVQGQNLGKQLIWLALRVCLLY